MEIYLAENRLVFDENRGVPIECMHPQKPDWVILGLSGEPPAGMTAAQAKARFREEQEVRLKVQDNVPKAATRSSARKGSQKASSTEAVPKAKATITKSKAKGSRSKANTNDDDDDEANDDEDDESSVVGKTLLVAT